MKQIQLLESCNNYCKTTDDPTLNKFKFIDLFAGIGGFRLGLESVGGECVFSAEIDTHACDMYTANFGNNPFCDITKLDAKTIPDFDILCAGFPCQAFSICGKQKGFYDETRGTLFFDICRILEEKLPKAFILENVANLETHDKGNTLSVMLESLTSLGYIVNYKVLNARHFGVPQNRERIIIIGSRNGSGFDFDMLKTDTIETMKPFLDTEGEFEYLDNDTFTLIDNYKKQSKSGLIFIGYRNKKIRTVGVRPGTEHLSRVHKQPNRIYSADGVHPTIASQEQSGRYWIYNENKVRKLTINECFKFMGFPSDFKKIGLKSKLYERIGNSICVNMVKEVATCVYNQIILAENKMSNNTSVHQFLETVYNDASKLKSVTSVNLPSYVLNWVTAIYTNEANFKGVYTVLFTSLTYKSLNPAQDVRRHQTNEMKNGYSGRTFDTKNITPFLKKKKFLGAMKESGWLTRSLEQNLPYDLKYPGKINNKAVKEAFLNILNCIEVTDIDPRDILLVLIKGSLIIKAQQVVVLVNPITSESNTSIEQIIEMLHKHFYFKFKSRGASILPVIALYSVYECIIKELKRFDGKYLSKLESHTSSDRRSSGATGDIVIKCVDDDSLYEVIEVKFDIPIDSIMISDAYEKFKTAQIQRYYVLSTSEIDKNEEVEINQLISDISAEHGCQVIVNGVLKTLKYYLRLLDNTDLFLKCYLNNLQNNEEINYEHKIAWNTIVN